MEMKRKAISINTISKHTFIIVLFYTFIIVHIYKIKFMYTKSSYHNDKLILLQ